MHCTHNLSYYESKGGVLFICGEIRVLIACRLHKIWEYFGVRCNPILYVVSYRTKAKLGKVFIRVQAEHRPLHNMVGANKLNAGLAGTVVLEYQG